MHVKLLGAAALTAGVLAFGLATPAFASTSDYAPVHNPVSISCHDQNYGQENRDCFPPVTHEDNNCMQPYLTGSRYDFRYQVQPQDCFRPPVCTTWDNTWQNGNTGRTTAATARRPRPATRSSA